ncbi:MAG: hypothetical protein WA584_23485 [Pyrinomonadaceae bacterium]
MSRIKCFFLEETENVSIFVSTNGDGKSQGESVGLTYRRTDTGEEYADLRDVPVGAMWFADWYDAMFAAQLAHVLVVKTPGGDWIVDSQSANCGLPEDYLQQTHHCWIIEGDLPNITVSKNGKTCVAGAGSIQAGSYHGFLRNGYLEECQ